MEAQIELLLEEKFENVRFSQINITRRFCGETVEFYSNIQQFIQYNLNKDKLYFSSLQQNINEIHGMAKKSIN